MEATMKESMYNSNRGWSEWRWHLSKTCAVLGKEDYIKAEKQKEEETRKH